jgi:hypothetical protein
MKYGLVTFLNLHVEYVIPFPLVLKFSPSVFKYTMFFCTNLNLYVMFYIFVANNDLKVI